MPENSPTPNNQENLPDLSDFQAENSSHSVDPTILDPQILDAVKETARRTTISIQQSHSGPMPSPKVMAEYERILPGISSDIRDEFLANGAHIRRFEEKSLDAHIKNDDKNRQVARELIWGALVGSVVLALTGHDWVAGIFAASTVGLVVTGFLQSKKSSKKDLETDTNDNQAQE